MRTLICLELSLSTLSLSSVAWAQNFPPAGVDSTPSMGQFGLRLTKEMGEKFGIEGCPGNWDNRRDPCVLWSPVLQEDFTQIGRSDPHTEDSDTDIKFGAKICQSATPDGCSEFSETPVKDSDLEPFPNIKFIEGPQSAADPATNVLAATREVHTQILSLNMIHIKPSCCGSSGKEVPPYYQFCTVNRPSANAVRAGDAMIVVPSDKRNRSLGEVESRNYPGSDFPAESFFNMFVEVDLDWDQDGNKDMTVYNPSIPLTVQNSEVDAFPPHVIYVHGGSKENNGAPPVYDVATGQQVGWIVLAGHGTGETPNCVVGSASSGGAPPLEMRKIFGEAETSLFQQKFEEILASDDMLMEKPWAPPPPPPEPPSDLLPKEFGLQVAVDGSGRGQVDSNIGLSCHTDDCTIDPKDATKNLCRNNCSQTVKALSTVSLIPKAEEGSIFSSWGGTNPDCADGQLMMNMSMLCTAYFRKIQSNLSVIVAGPGQLDVNVGKLTWTTPQEGHATYDYGTPVTLVPIPAPNSSWVGWRGHSDCLDGQVEMKEDLSCVAEFSLKQEESTSPSPQPVTPPVTVTPIPSPPDTTSPSSPPIEIPKATPTTPEIIPPPSTPETPPTTPEVIEKPTPIPESPEVVTPPPSSETPVPQPPFPQPPSGDSAPIFSQPPPMVNNVSDSCPTTGIVEQFCNYQGRHIGQLEVRTRGVVTNGILEGTLENHGWVSNFTIGPDGELKGGIVTGYIKNEGVMCDFEFKGASIVKGRLCGQIVNSSSIGGYFKNVTLLPDSSITGGKLMGKIIGDPKKPAWLENLTIMAGSEVSGVKLGKNVRVEKGAKVEEAKMEEKLLPPSSISVDFPKLGPAMVHDAKGNKIETQTQVSGGISKDGRTFQMQMKVEPLMDDVTIYGHLQVDPEHVGKRAEVVVYMTYQATAQAQPLYLMKDERGGIFLWNEKPETLIAFQEEVRLTSEVLVKIYEGILMFQGIVKIHFGYRLDDGRIIESERTLDLEVSS